MEKPHILFVDDDADMLRLMALRLQAAGYRVTTAASAEAALAQIGHERPELVISDVRLPGQDGMALFEQLRQRYAGLPVIMLTAHGTIPDAVEAMERGVFCYLTKPFDARVLLDKVAQALSVAAPVQAAQTTETAWRAGIISRSQIMEELLGETRLVAASDASVLVQGESGAGKELLAKAIHRASPRAKGPFVAVNCGAIPEQLLESELFGHIKGAFTGALNNHRGLFQTAHGGTLLLDEIGDMPLPLQVKLLRVLQEKAVRPVGASEAVAVDVRIVSATHRDLDAAIAQGLFREDLYYRLNVVSLTLPPLSERREDIPLLAAHFLAQVAGKYNKPVTGYAPDAMEALLAASWPGNVRQLYNVVEQVCALASAPIIPLGLVQRALRLPAQGILNYNEAKTRFERDYLTQLLKVADGNVTDAARMAGRNRTEFYRLLQKNGLDPALFRQPGEGVAG
ncbi:sigma 54-interacting transcriptional regulator [Amantichitinum ursilacus]|uniref:Transcriptional regulatory protein QseF n=1 Tax=Amantichitinum ursilacus TaxID=857265 RepID=A0A0N0XGU9_9NEIS|nr:sigma 54-interacting transcriptional regulator [Amantichitinum ursilacus]KPC50432.1 Transcriptional regulatory protein QseF [Amantichitinum ursilacus]